MFFGFHNLFTRGEFIMNPYQNSFRPSRPNSNYGDRQFVFPFLVGALTGGAAVGLTRPRPIYNVAPNYGPPYPPPMPPRPYGAPYMNYSYSYYQPY